VTKKCFLRGERLAYVQQAFHSSGMEDALLEARFFVESFGDFPEEMFQQKVARRIAGEPMAYLEGSKGFWKHDFLVSSEVLIPRPETEILVEWGLEILTSRGEPSPEESSPLPEVWDFGTGSGCVLLSLLAEFPLAIGRGWDASSSALKVASENGRRLGLNERCQWGVSDWWDATPACSAQLVIANPPYILPGEWLDPAVEEFEPTEALFTPADLPMEPYRKITEGFVAAAPPGSCLLFEIGAGREAEVQEVGMDFGLKELGVRPDLAGIIRAVGFKKPMLG